MNRPFNWDIMSENGLSGSPYQQDEIAALMRDLGVLNNASYGTAGTSASFNINDFERAFGYAPISTMRSSHGNFFHNH